MYFRDLTSRPHLAGRPEDRESAEVIEQRWKTDSLLVTKTKYNALFSYPDENRTNVYVNNNNNTKNTRHSLFFFRVTLFDDNGTIIFQTSGIEHVYDPTQPKTVNPFLAYTANGTASSVS